MFYYPGDLCVRHGLPNCRDRRQRVDDVTDASQFYDKNAHPKFRITLSVIFPIYSTFNQTVVGLKQRSSNFLDYISIKRAIMSDVEWSFGSPTIATRPPKDFTTSRSGTVSTV